MAEQLGSLARTHTCGALRPADVGAKVVLLGWVHRVRDLGSLLFVDVRDRHGITQVIVEGDDTSARARQAVCARSSSSRSLGEAERRSADTVNLSPADRRGRSARERTARAQRGAHAAVPHRRRSDRVGRSAAQVPVSRPSPSAAAAQHRPAPSHHDGDSPLFRRAGLLRDRNADPHEVHSRRRARLPGAEPRPRRQSSTRCRNRRRSSSSC